MAPKVDQTGRVDLVVAQGATFTATFTWKIDGTPVDLSGYTGAAKIKDTYGGSTLATFTVTLGGAAGTITLTLSATTTGALSAPATGVWDVELTSGSTVRRLVGGTVTITPEVTA